MWSSFQVEVPFFLKRFSEWFFSQKWCQMEPQMASKRSQNLIKNELETKSTKHVENVLNLTPLDLQETRFRMEGLSKITKTRGADKSKTIQKMVSKWSHNPWKFVFRTQQKKMLKNRAQKTEKITKTDPKMVPKRWVYFGGNPTGAPLVVQTVFVMKKLAPSAPKVRPRTTNGPKYLKK